MTNTSRTLRFQRWAVGTIFVLVLVLTGIFLFFLLRELRTQAEQGAEREFSQLASGVVDEIDEVLKVNRRYVEVIASHASKAADPASFLDAATAATAMRGNERIAALLMALPNDEGVMVEDVAATMLARPLTAIPASADYAVTRSWHDRAGQHWSEQTFYSAEGAVLGRATAKTVYKPTLRPWYQNAIAQHKTQVSDAFSFIDKTGLGLIFSAPLANSKGVVATVLSTQAFGKILARPKLSPNAAVVVMNQGQQVLALRVNGSGYGMPANLNQLTTLKEMGSTRLAQLAPLLEPSAPITGNRVVLDGEPFVVSTASIPVVPGTTFHAYIVAPMRDFTGALDQSARYVVGVAILLLLAMLPLAWWSTRPVATALAAMAAHALRLRRLDFATPPPRIKSFVAEIHALGQAQEVMHASLAQRTAALEQTKFKLAQLVQVGVQLSAETNRKKFLQDLLAAARELAACTTASLSIRNAQDVLENKLSVGTASLAPGDIAIHAPTTGLAQTQFLAVRALLDRQTMVVDAADDKAWQELNIAVDAAHAADARIRSILLVPLFTSDGQALGVLQLLNAHDAAGQPVPFAPEDVRMVEALASQVTVAIENQRLSDAQRDLTDAMVRIFADAVDAKSAYTGGHCARVPELAVMLAEEATRVQHGPLKEFGFTSDEEWREFRVGAWLHDCGKVTTPEFVMDKATKLETIYNRLHEVRMRFEVLLRDARIAMLEALASGQDPTAARTALAQREQQLQDDFAFIAASNIGSEYMAPERIERLRAMASQTWLRHFDDRIGLSAQELDRYAQEQTPAPALPATEHLLADKLHHLVARQTGQAFDPSYQFKLEVPEHLYNHGELHNLSISRGTLTAEERFKINEHIALTIMMLEKLPLPANLQRVPEYAGTHHETMAGTGYPRKLDATRLSVPSRIMAIADIFEALTAPDRPYKSAKPLSEAVRILHAFKKDRHIDPVLFDLFLSSGVYMRYAKRFLAPAQIDAVDTAAYVDH